MKNKKNKIWSNNFLFFILVFLLVLLSDILNSYGDKLRIRKNMLQQEINLLHTRYIETYTKLSNFQLIGQLEKLIKQRNLNLTRSDKPPYIIYVDKKQKKH